MSAVKVKLISAGGLAKPGLSLVTHSGQNLWMGGDCPVGFHLCFVQMMWFCCSLSGNDHQCALQLSVKQFTSNSEAKVLWKTELPFSDSSERVQVTQRLVKSEGKMEHEINRRCCTVAMVVVGS